MENIIGSMIKELRKQNGLTQKELANQINVSFQTVSKYELGVNFPDTDTLLKLSNIFDCTVDYLIGNSNATKFTNKDDYPYDITPLELQKIINILKYSYIDIDKIIYKVKSES